MPVSMHFVEFPTLFLSSEYKESKYRMTRYQDDYTDEDIDDGLFCFFELLLISS